MIEQTLAIVRNTFFESIRQPIVAVLLVVATLMLIIGNVTATFTMSDDQKMLIDVGLATVFLFGALLAAFIATNVLTREIDNKTVLTVVSKPVSRPIFVLGKYLGVAAAILVASLYMSFVFMLVEHHGVMQTVRDPYHLPVIVFGLTAGAIALVVSVWCNYFYGKVFSSTLVVTATPLAALAYVLSLLFEPDFARANVAEAFNANLWTAIAALIIANLVLTGVALAASTRLGQIMTIVVTVGIFVTGMLSDWLFADQMARPHREAAVERGIAEGDFATVNVEQVVTLTNGEVARGTREIVVVANEAFQNLTDNQLADLESGAATPVQLGLERIEFTDVLANLSSLGDQAVYLAGKIGHSIFPNFQVLWLSDAVTQGHVIPTAYLLKVALYGGTSIIAALCLAVILFERREVG